MILNEFIKETQKNQMISTLLKHYKVGNVKMKIGDKVKVNKDIPSVNGMLREGTVVRIDHILSKSDNNFRVTDDLGKIWYLSEDDITDA